MNLHSAFHGFEESRIVRFVFDHPADGGRDAHITFVLQKDDRQRILVFTVPADGIQFMEQLVPPSLEVIDHSGEGWEGNTLELVHPHSGHTYFYARSVVTDAQIDDALRTAADSRWLKVAAVISDAVKSLGTSLPGGRHGCDTVAERLYALVDSGQLIADGEVTNWRHSEVRLP